MTSNIEESSSAEPQKTASKKAAANRPKTPRKTRPPLIPFQLPDALPAPDPSTYPVYTPTRIYLPEKVIPDQKNILILNQGSEGNGTGFALAALINYLTSLRGEMKHASPRMIYEVAKTYDGAGDKLDPGSTLTSALYGATVYGVTTETLWPYVPNKPDRLLTPEREQSAREFKLTSFSRIPKDRDALRTAIVEHGAVLVGAMIHDGWMHLPISVIPFTGKENNVGGHAFPILGYTPEGFIVQLSWGTTDIGITLDGVEYPGLVIWTYPDFDKNFFDGFVVELPAGVRKIPAGLRAGYTADNATAVSFSDDTLNVAPDVRAICALLAARDIQPPLALGLFGNWGTGKSFFMRLMKLEIERLAALTHKNPGKTPYYERIVQIEFNAWHFLDTNLWASLVSEIFNKLHDQIDSSPVLSTERRNELLKRLGEAEGIYRHSRLEFDDAQRAQKSAQEAADAAKSQVAKNEKQLRTLREIEQKSNLVAQAFGIPLLAQSTANLADAAMTLENTPTRLGKVWKMVWQSPDRWKLLAWLGVILLGPLLLGWLASLLPILPGGLHQLFQETVTVLSWLAAIIGWLAPRLSQMSRGISALEDAAAQVQSVPEVKDTSMTELEANIQESLAKTQTAETEAQAKLDQAQKTVEDLQRQLDELNPRWQMQQFILDRSGSQDYSKQLGLVSLIRRDFEQLSQLLRENQEEEQRLQQASSPPDGAGGGKGAQTPAPAALPFQRIILYIDDLDRCSPDRVVEVLEAVHLLLAFPLFIVVVAVDPRWLRTCLEIRYRDLLKKDDSINGKKTVDDQSATPQDYLEKIFQIPFYLRPLSRSNFTSMVQGLLGGEATSAAQESAVPSGKQQQIQALKDTAGTIMKAAADAASVIGPSIPSASISSAVLNTTAGAISPKITSPEDEVINPDLLKLDKIELDDMLQFSPLFRTPRAVKRFINTYRLVRVGVKPETLENFISGTPEGLILHRVAMVLLAVVAGYPNQAPRFLHLLLDQMRSSDPAQTWTSFLETCRVTGPGSPAGAQPGEDPLSNPDSENPTPEADWQGLLSALESVSQDGFLPDDLSVYYDLVPPVARFSFSVSDLPGLRKK